MGLLACVPPFAEAHGAHANWELLSGPVDPPQATGHAALYDPRQQRMLMLNGLNPAEIWQLTLTASADPEWSRIPIPGADQPAARMLFSAVVDSARNRILLFGGEWGAAAWNDVWSLSLDDHPRWTRILPAGEGPSARSQCSTIFDPRRDRMIVFGGASHPVYEDRVYYSDTWVLELAGAPTWRRASPVGGPPQERKGANAVYDADQDRMLLFGGFAFPAPFAPWPLPSAWNYDDTWELRLDGELAWTRLATTQPPTARQEHVAVLDPVRREVVISGGNSLTWPPSTHDTWALSLDPGPGAEPLVWRRIETLGDHPDISRHAAVYSPERRSLVQFGGNEFGNGCFELDLDHATWSRVNSSIQGPFPSRRALPTLIADDRPGRLVLFGGGWGCQHDLWEFPIHDQGGGWSRLPTTGLAPTCRAPNFVYDATRRRLLSITGGSMPRRGHLMDQVWALNLAGDPAWTQLQVTGPMPPGRVDYSLVHDPVRDRVLLFGGASYASPADNFGTDRDDVWALSLADLRWVELRPVNSPGPRRAHWAAYDPIRDHMLVVAGGRSGFLDTYPIFGCWSLSLGADSLRWNLLGPDAPVSEAAAFDPWRDRVLLWDGSGSAWALPLREPDAWRPIALAGETPPARHYFGLTFDPEGDQLLTFGGYDGSLMGDLRALRFSREVEVALEQGRAGLHPPGHSRGQVAAVVFGSESFAVDSILVETVTLGGAPALETPPRDPRAVARDVNHDGHPDLELRFVADAVRPDARDGALRLRGDTPHFAVRGLARNRAVPGSARPSARPAEQEGRPAVWAPMPGGSATSAELRYTLPSSADASLELFDLAGRRVLAWQLRAPRAGTHRLELDRTQAPRGLYWARLRQGDQVAIARLVLLEP